MKKIILSLAVIAIAGTIVVGATRAYFTSTQTSAGNTFAAGKLDLQLGGDPETLPFNVSDMVPGQSGEGRVTLTNDSGSIPGQLNVSFANLVGSENGLTTSGIAAGDYENGGDLQLFMRFAAFVDVNKNGIFDTGDIQLTYDGQQRAYPGFWDGDFHYAPISGMMNGAWNNIMTLNGGDSANLVVMWKFPAESEDSNYNQNIAMTDSLGFDIKTSLEQVH